MSGYGNPNLHGSKRRMPRTPVRVQGWKVPYQTEICREVKEALGEAGIDLTGYSGHSFRSGAATTAAAKGSSDSAIKMLGRWKSEAYQLYIKTPRDQLAAVSRQLVKQKPSVMLMWLRLDHIQLHINQVAVALYWNMSGKIQ